MSYDIYLVAERCSHCGRSDSPFTDWNYTSNCVPMWNKAMPPDGLAALDGMLAEDAAPVLRAGIKAMEADPGAYRELNPPNGWGDFDSQLAALKKLLGHMEAYPKCRVGVSR